MEDNSMPHSGELNLINELFAQVQFLIDHMDSIGALPEHCFTFPDGDTWWATGHPVVLEF